MPVTSPPRVRARWLSTRSMLLHLMVLLAVPLCLVAGWWQATRAMSGNTLSYFYAVEWPVFAVLAVGGWWQLLHIPPAPATPDGTEAGGDDNTGAAAGPGGPVGLQPVQWDSALETPALQAYNDYLAELPATGQRPRRQPRRR